MRCLLFRASLLFILTLPALAQSYYHEASCPSVDQRTMTRMKRDVAESMGMLPAWDCHPEVRVRYLGIVSPADAPRLQHVSGYTRADGTIVPDYTRRLPERSDSAGGDAPVSDYLRAVRTTHVSGYWRADGTYVRPHERRRP